MTKKKYHELVVLNNTKITTKLKLKNYEKSIIVTNNGIIHSKNKFTTF